jgi:hypothetical protein
MRGPKRSERAAIILALIVGLQLFHKVIGNKALADANGTSLSGDLKSMLEGLIDTSACCESPLATSRRVIINREADGELDVPSAIDALCAARSMLQECQRDSIAQCR